MNGDQQCAFPSSTATLYTQLVLPIRQVLRAESLKKLRLGVELNPFQPENPSADPATSLSLTIVQLLLPQLKYCTELRELKVVVKDTVQMWSSKNVRYICNIQSYVICVVIVMKKICKLNY